MLEEGAHAGGVTQGGGEPSGGVDIGTLVLLDDITLCQLGERHRRRMAGR
jgi:hypothetical protein